MASLKSLELISKTSNKVMINHISTRKIHACKKLENASNAMDILKKQLLNSNLGKDTQSNEKKRDFSKGNNKASSYNNKKEFSFVKKDFVKKDFVKKDFVKKDFVKKDYNKKDFNKRDSNSKDFTRKKHPSKYTFNKKKESYEKKIKYDLGFLETGNDRDKAAAKRILSEAVANNKKGIIQLIVPKEPIKICQILEVYQSMILKDKGLIIVGSKNIDETNCDETKLDIGSKMIIVKLVDRDISSKQYSDYLAEQAVEKLKLSKSSIIDKQNKKKDDNNNSGGTEIKIVQIGWNISINDLTGQKKFEIENHLKKGNDVEIVIDDREFLDKDNSSNTTSIFEANDDLMKLYNNRRKELTEAEKSKRTKILETIKENILSLEGLNQSNIGEEKGFFESRLIIRVKGVNKNDKESKNDKKEKKRLEKAMKAEKIQKRREEKERLERENMKEIEA